MELFISTIEKCIMKTCLWKFEKNFLNLHTLAGNHIYVLLIFFD